MKLTLLFGLLLVAVAPATAQKHAPTTAQCQADAAVWGKPETHGEYFKAQADFLNHGIPNTTDIAKLSLDEVNARIGEMIDCEDVDPSNNLQYVQTLNFYDDVVAGRVRDFMTRHGLWPQFKLEDKQGKR